AARGRRDRPHGLPAVALLPPPGREQPGGGQGPRRRPVARLRTGQRLLRGPEERAGGAGEGQRGDRADRARGRPSAGGDRRRPLPASRGLRQPPGAALRPDQVHARAAQAVLRHQRVLLEGLRGDGDGIAVGPGRGSAAGSIVAYSLNITDVDPLRYGLLFERFLNAERVSMPDIDIGFSVKGRDRVIRYVAGKYGQESVAQIITFGRM